MLAILFISALIGGAVAQQTTPARCCVPDQFEAIINTGALTVTPGSGDHHGSSTSSSIAYDNTNKRAFSDTSIPDQPGVKVIIDYVKRKQYYIRGNDCTVSDTEGEWRQGCIPEDATFSGFIYHGAGTEKIYSNSWSYQVEQFHITAAYSRDHCYPLGQGVYGDFTDFIWAANMDIVNITVGIRDPSIFNPPSSCQEVATHTHKFSQHHPFNEFVRSTITRR